MPAEVGKTVEISVMSAFFATLAAAGVAICALVVRDFAHARDSRSWERVEGVVLSAPSDGAPALRYAYVAGGKAYESSRSKFVTAALSKAPIKTVAPGQRIDVLVSPENPSLSVLQPGGSSFLFSFVTAAAALLVFLGVGGLVRTVMNGRNAEAAQT